MEGPNGGIDPEPQKDGSDSEGGSDLRLASGILNALTDVLGVEVGHYAHDRVQRGVTAILCKAGATAGVSVRGANPGTFNTDALAPTTSGGVVHGIGLAGGSRSFVGGATIEPERMWRVASDLLLGFFNAHLNGTPAPHLDGPSPEYPEVQFVDEDQ